MLDAGSDAPPAPAGTDPDDADPEVGAGPEARPRLLDRLFPVCLLVAVLPVVVAVVRAGIDGWLPIGDNGYFAVRARDVLTGNHPWLGTWTSASLNTDTNFNNPGPLYFDVLALPAKLIDAGIGVAVGVAVLNVAAIVGIGLVAERRGGPLLGIAALAAATLLAWTMGSEMLFDPWQPNGLLLTFLLLLLLVWSMAEGDLAAAPWAVAAASLIVQTHLSYAILLVALGTWAVVGLVLALRRRRTADPEGWVAQRRSLTRWAGAAVVVAGLCWAQPLAEQVRRGSDGNLARLAGNAADSPRTVGPDLAVRTMAEVVALPPSWLRPSFRDAMVPGPDEPVPAPGEARDQVWVGPSTPVAAALVGGIALAVAAAWWDASRRRDHVAATALATTLVVGGAGLVTLIQLPFGQFGLPPHHFRWLWPAAAFGTTALAVWTLRRFAGRPGAARTAGLALLVVTVVAAGHNLAHHNARTGPSADAWAIPVVRQLNEQMGALEGQGPLHLVMGGIRWNEPYSGAIMVELQRRKIPFVVDDEGMVRQLGERRRLRQPAQRLLIREGDATRDAPEGARRAVLVEGLDAGERRELDELRAAVARHLEQLPRIPLTDRGEEALRHPDREDMAASRVEHDVPRMLASRLVRDLVELGVVDVEGPWAQRYERYAELQTRWDYQTVAIFLAPPAAEAGG